MLFIAQIAINAGGSKSVDKMTVQTKAIEQHFHVVLLLSCTGDVTLRL